MEEPTKRLCEVILSAAQLVILIAGGLWAYFRFLRERTHSPRIFLDTTCKFHGPQSTFYIAAFYIRIRNEGLVTQRFSDIRLRALGISRDSPVEEWKEDPPRVAFPLKLIDVQIIYKKKYGHVFVEPGIEQQLTYVARIPGNVAFVLTRADFTYKGRRKERTHSYERMFEVPRIGLPNHGMQADAQKDARG